MIRCAGLLACWALASCGPSDEKEGTLGACLPESLRDSCAAEASIDLYRACFDGSGSCTWSEDRAESSYELLVEWENGARITSVETDSGTSATIEAASGERCTLTPIETAECRGYRFGSSQRWYEYCVLSDEDTGEYLGFDYTCDDGSEGTVSAEDLAGAGRACTLPITSPSADCVDAEGRRLGERRGSPDPAPPPCSGEACGDIGSRCTDEMSCDQGLTCQSTNVDPSVVYGFCTGPCDDSTPCPDGTACANVFQPASGEIRRQCMRSCREQADCAPFGSSCSAGIAFCN